MKKINFKEFEKSFNEFSDELRNEIVEYMKDSVEERLNIDGTSDLLIDIRELKYVRGEIKNAIEVNIKDKESFIELFKNDYIFKEFENDNYDRVEFPISIAVKVRDNDFIFDNEMNIKYKFYIIENNYEYGILFYIDRVYNEVKALIYAIYVGE